ncbi:plasmid pRiA4b ORF-3 family protein [Paenarthrobacter sp. NPDC057355]|uniref:plasmid pRiA4b ORF-3 family protein n=1 Tax=Paenarthrobacter sp. NPDC057355 TaxID=3346105 RepID=UPI00363B2999
MQPSTTVAAIELRISISETEPLIWRQLVLPESSTVAELHEAIQCAFGWKNSHLYALAGHNKSGKKRLIFALDDGDGPAGAEVAANVRLLELFDPAAVGLSDLEYEYDFGDSWTHEIEVVGQAVLQKPAITCVAGAMRGPVEDSGGVQGYANVVRVVGTPGHPEHREAVEWLEFVTQEGISKFDPGAFDMAAINRQLELLARRLWPAETTEADIEFVLGPILWFLNEANPDGLPLTTAGYLKPVVVKRAMADLEWTEPWQGSVSTESHAAPVRVVRERLQEWKLLRKSKDKLLLTPAGRKLVNKPAMLWHYIADRLASPGHPGVQIGTQLKVHWELTGSYPPMGLRDEVIQLALHEHGLRTVAGADIPLDWARGLRIDVHQSFLCLRLWNTKKWGTDENELSPAGINFLLDVQSRWGD